MACAAVNVVEVAFLAAFDGTSHYYCLVVELAPGGSATNGTT